MLWDVIEKVLQQMFCFASQARRDSIFQICSMLGNIKMGKAEGFYLVAGKKKVLKDAPSLSFPFLLPES